MTGVKRISNWVRVLREQHQLHRAVENRRREMQQVLVRTSAVLRRAGESDTSRLTICSVNYQTKFALDLNANLTASLNPEMVHSTTWLVIDNSRESEEMIGPDDQRFTVIGEKNCSFPSAYGHGAGLNELLPEIRTQFVLFLDPDCYIVRQHWIDEVLNYMVDKKLAFFGTPTHPRVISRFRYFPSPICMFVDLSRVPIHSLDFTSRGAEWKRNLLYYTILPRLERLPSRIGTELRRLRIGRLHDVGYAIYREYVNKPDTLYENVVPVFDPPATPSNLIKRCILDLLPDSLSFVPKRPGYFSVTGFHERGYFGVAELGWEEFLWKEEPFAFHVRSGAGGWKDKYAFRPLLVEAVNWFISNAR